jgi:ATP-binding cassette subfamily C protein
VSEGAAFVLQSGVLGLGAYLVIQQQATAGIIIASSIIVARALAPVELAIANWRGFVAARQSWKRLSDVLPAWIRAWSRCPLPPPKANLVVETVTAGPPGVPAPRHSGRQLRLEGRPGARRHRPKRVRQVLARARDRRRVDARARQGAARRRGHSTSGGRPSSASTSAYLPQDVELFAGTVGQNIARFEQDAPAKRSSPRARRPACTT